MATIMLAISTKTAKNMTTMVLIGTQIRAIIQVVLKTTKNRAKVNYKMK